MKDNSEFIKYKEAFDKIKETLCKDYPDCFDCVMYGDCLSLEIGDIISEVEQQQNKGLN